MAFKLLALDIDGTALDSRGSLSPGVQHALQAGRRLGLRIVLCTGRRFRTARPVLEDLSLDGPVVVHNGVLVKNAATGETVRHRYLDRELFHDIRQEVSGVGPPLVYVDSLHPEVDIVAESCESAHVFQRDYMSENDEVIEFVESLDQPAPPRVIMLSCMADEESLRPIEARVQSRFGERVRTHLLTNTSYRGFILEVAAAGAGKWPALAAIAAEFGVDTEEIIAIGDDNNDVEMISNAGLGIAMENAAEAAREVADWIAPSNDEDGVAAALEEWVL